MKKTTPAMLALALVLPPFGTWAGDGEASDLPSDYSHILPLGVSGRQGVVGLRLPQAVYLRSRSAELADLRVFDAQGAKTPFALYRPEPQTRSRRRAWPVKRFPVLAGRGLAMDGIALDVKTGPDGTLLSVKTRPGKEAGGGRVLAGLVLDLGRSESAVAALRFVPKDRGAYSAQVWLEVGDDLKHWETVGAAELGWLVNAQTGETLANDRLEFAPRRFRYARLRWRDGEPADFAAIEAEAVEQSADAPFLERLVLQPAPGRAPGDWVYRASAAIPVEKIELRFREPNVVLPAEVGTYREQPGRKLGRPSEWVFQPLARQVFYQIDQGGEARRSGERPVPLSHFAEWVVRPQTPAALQPELGLAWQPATLVFLAGGHPPYRLAFGRGDARPAAAPLEQVAPGFSAQELARLEQAQAGPLQTQPAAEAGASAAELAGRAAQNRMLMLWGVLLAGVGVLGAMAWRLLRQMK